MRHALHTLLAACALPLVAQPALPAAAATPAASATSTASPPLPGKALFDRWCAECHAPGHGHPGTQQLERLRGASLAVLDSRPDLNAALVRYVVRNGQNAMPPYRPSEISDAQLDEIARYLGRNQPAPGRRRR